jgi:UrcA family protein
MKITEALAAAAIAATIACAPTQAQTFSFTFDGWLLSSPQGRLQIVESLERQVENYCEVRSARGAWQVRVALDCKDRVMANALEQIGDERIIALVHERERERHQARRA